MPIETLDPSRREPSASAGTAAATATVAPARLFATDAGSGRNVMFLHGWTCDSNDWSWQLPLFESRYRVVAPDLRGHGRSEVMPSGAYAPTDYVGDVEALIETDYPGERFLIVGHSMGGQIAARLAAKRPDLVSGVVSVDGALGFTGDAVQFFRRVADDLETGDPGVVAPALFGLVYGPDTDPAYKRWHARRVLGMPAHVVRESFAPLFFGPDQVGVGEPCERFCRSLEVPFYHLCLTTEQVDRMRPWFSDPKSRVEAWSGVGHWIMLDRKDDVNAAIVDWIETV